MASQAIIFIPGTKGTQLEDRNTFGHDPIWRDIRFNFSPIQVLELTRNYGKGYFEKDNDTLIQPGSLEGIVYKEFIYDLWPEKPVFLFNYDWRLPNADTADKLDEFINMLKDRSESANKATKGKNDEVKVIKKVDIVVHSQGNHVLRNYIMKKGFQSLERVVFVTPPFLGSLEMVKAMLCGQGFLWTREKTRKIVRTFPGCFELLPRYDHAANFINGDHVDFFEYDHWQESRGIVENKEHFTEMLKKAKKSVDKLNENWLKDIPVGHKRKMMVIVKDGFDTLQRVKVDTTARVKNEVDFDNVLINENGDKVVPHASSTAFAREIATYRVKKALWKEDNSHAFVMKEERVQRLINRFLSGKAIGSMPGKNIERVAKPIEVPDWP